MKNPWGMTLTELIVASALALAVMIIVTAIIVAMMTVQNDVTIRIKADMGFVEADAHIKKHVHESAYVEIPDANTLRLYGYSSNLTGTYSTASGHLTYTPNVANPVATHFSSTNATFTQIDPPVGTTGKIKEIRVNYVLPFANLLYLKCGTEFESGSWAYYVQNINISKIIGNLSGKAGNPDGFLIIGDIAMGGGLWYRCITKYAQGADPLKDPPLWSYYYSSLDFAIKEARQVFAQDGSPSGYILAGYSGRYTYAAKISDIGIPEWVSRFMPGDDFSVGNSCMQVHNADGALNGYIVAGFVALDDGFYLNDNAYIIKIAEAGGMEWAHTFRFNLPYTAQDQALTGQAPPSTYEYEGERPFDVVEVVNGGSVEYVIAGILSVPSYMAHPPGREDAFLMRISAEGLAIKTNVYHQRNGPEESHFDTSYLNRGYRLFPTYQGVGGDFDGYMLLGRGVTTTQLDHVDFVSIRTTTDGSVTSARSYHYGGGMGDVYACKTSGGYVMTLGDYSVSTCAVAMLEVRSDETYGLFKRYDIAAKTAFGLGITDVAQPGHEYIMSFRTSYPSRYLLFKTDTTGNCPALSSPENLTIPVTSGPVSPTPVSEFTAYTHYDIPCQAPYYTEYPLTISTTVHQD